MSTVYLEKSDIYSTLTTWVYCHIWQLYSAEILGHKGYIHWPQQHMRSLQQYQDSAKFAECPNMYDWYFEQPLFSAPPPRELTWMWENCPEAGQYPLMSQPVATMRAYFQKHLRFNAAVSARGQALVTKYNLDFSNLLGLSWRGTDCVTDGRPRMPIETYFPFIDDILAEEPNLRIFATAEEEGVLAPLLARYPQAFTMSEFFAAPLGSMQNPDRLVALSGYERGMCPALMVWVLSQCKHYIKNRSSSGMIASWLSNGNIVCLAHGENGGHGFDLSKAEVKGKIVPLNR